MKEYALLFRMDLTSESAQPTPEQMEGYMTQWMDWTDDLVNKGQLSGGHHFSKSGRVMSSKGVIANAPYISNNESVAGYLLILAENLDAASEIGLTCPILNGEHTSVEVRALENPGN